MILAQKPYDTKTLSTYQLQSKIGNEIFSNKKVFFDK
jgi:hypothetical protein